MGAPCRSPALGLLAAALLACGAPAGGGGGSQPAGSPDPGVTPPPAPAPGSGAGAGARCDAAPYHLRYQGQFVKRFVAAAQGAAKA